jgi:uncharacterized protein
MEGTLDEGDEPFVNRSEERRSFDALLGSEKATLGRLFGRRRLGKTELLRDAMRRHGGGFFVTIPEQTRVGIMRHLSEEASRQAGRPLRYVGFREFLRDLPRLGQRIVVLDEFQRLKEADKSADSALQEAWDAQLQHSGIVLILCGSVVGMMRRLNGRAAPLYGRFSWDLELKPFTYSSVRLFYPDATEEERVARFGVFGSTPHYHRISRGLPLEEAIRRLFLDAAAPLREEPRLLIEMELRKPDRYQEIMEALGRGKRTLGEIAGMYGEPASAYTPYVQRLRDEMGILRSEDPVGGKRRKGRVSFDDLFFQFYYGSIYPNLTRLELGGADAVMREIRERLPSYLGKPAFEEVARETLRAANGTTYSGIAFDLRELGGWWDGEEELDAVALGKDVAYACEAKFRKQPCGAKEVETLLRRAELFREQAGKARVVPILLSAGGFDAAARKRIASGEVVGWTLDDVAAIHEKREPTRKPRKRA